MTSFYIVLEVTALIAIIVIPTTSPKTKKNLPVASTGNLAINNKVTWNQFLQTNRIIIRCIN